MQLLVHDDHEETAANRRAQLAAIVGAGATVAATSSRNKLLADIARAPAREPVIALIDLVDERDSLHRLGDRIIATIGRHPDLRERCIPVALTFHAGVEIQRAVYLAGARALIDSRALSDTDEAAPIRRLLTDLSRTHREDARRPRLSRPLTVLPPTDWAVEEVFEDGFAPAEFERWFGRRPESWRLHMLEAIADQGDEQQAIVQRMVSLQDAGRVEPAAAGTWKNRHTLTWQLLREGRRHPPELAAEFLSHVGAELEASAMQWRQPAFATLRRMPPQPRDLVAWAAFIGPADRATTERIVAAAAPLSPGKNPRAHLWATCQAAAAAPRSLPAKALLEIAGFVAHAIQDAKTDYERRPAVEAGHRLRRLVVPTYLLDRGPGAGQHTFFTDPTPLTLDETGVLRLDGMTAEQWECSARNPPPGALAWLERLDNGLGVPLTSSSQ